MKISIDEIIVDMELQFDEEIIKEYMESIRSLGVVLPIEVREDTDGNFHLLAGQARFIAAKKVGLKRIEVKIVKEDNVDDERWYLGKEKNIIEKLLEEICKPKIYLRVTLLFLLSGIHEVTRYKIARSFKDLFYWPEGLCLDTIVAISALLLIIQILFYCNRIIVKQMKYDYTEFIEEYEKIIK